MAQEIASFGAAQEYWTDACGEAFCSSIRYENEATFTMGTPRKKSRMC